MKTRATAYPVWNAFVPSPDSPLTLREQLLRFFRKGVADGTLKPGIRLPASRLLAQELGVSRMTVTGVYEQLLAEGFCEARQGAGTYVASRINARPPPSPTAPPGLLGGSLRARQLAGPDSMSLGHPDWPLTPGLPALDAFPYALWGRLEGRFWRGRLPTHSSYGDPQGSLPLRQALAEYLGVARGVVCTAEQIIITPGAQAAVSIAALALTDRGERAWVENPGYDATYRSLILAGLETVGVPVDAEGLDVQAGRRLAPDARLALVSPSHQYPTGVTMSLARRLALLQWADQANALILEDDYDSEFRYDCGPTPALKALDGHNGRVIYVGTLSKLLIPGLRLGFLVAPEGLVDVLQRVRNGSGHRVPKSLQATAADFIGNGHLGSHIRRAKALYSERRAALLAALDSHADGLLSVATAATGLHLLAYLPEGCDDQALTLAARRRQIGAGSLSSLWVTRPTAARHGLLLGFGNTPADAMPAAVRSLCQLIEAQLAGRSLD
ncbi:PLP-dependent aminotransferase family protein [Pseudomonas sp. NPDC087626]|uniref:MocR-like pyridoxine biosynthesis transcription factor PdxR n=1 Tax=Pseudomonas sp. NPDC087626 TaxID=3364444 RepID=UPI00381AB5DB